MRPQFCERGAANVFNGVDQIRIGGLGTSPIVFLYIFFDTALQRAKLAIWNVDGYKVKCISARDGKHLDAVSLPLEGLRVKRALWTDLDCNSHTGLAWQLVLCTLLVQLHRLADKRLNLLEQMGSMRCPTTLRRDIALD
jgi:hypothetical protein